MLIFSSDEDEAEPEPWVLVLAFFPFSCSASESELSDDDDDDEDEDEEDEEELLLPVFFSTFLSIFSCFPFTSSLLPGSAPFCRLLLSDWLTLSREGVFEACLARAFWSSVRLSGSGGVLLVWTLAF